MPAVGGGGLGEVLEHPVLPLGHAHLDQVEDVDREEVLLVLTGVGLEDHGVGGHQSGVVVVKPPSGGNGQTWRWPAVGKDITSRIVDWSTRGEVAHVAGPDEHGIAGLGSDPGMVHRSLEILHADLVTSGEQVLASSGCEIKEHAAGHDGSEVVDAEPS